MENNIYRYYKISINIFFYSSYKNTNVHKLPNKFVAVIVGFLYSLITILFGFWSFNIFNKFRGIKNSLIALDINLSGGEDITKLAIEGDFDEKTRFIYNNLLSQTCKFITIEELECIIDLQELYSKSKDHDNLKFINDRLDLVYQKRINSEILNDIVDTVQMYREIV